LSLRESHARFEITERQRVVWLGLMRETIHSLNDEPEIRVALDQFFEAGSAYVAGKDGSEIENPELSERWTKQVNLDQLIDNIVNRRDAEAIAIAGQFSSRRSVFVGILARMMESGRDPLIAFVLESLQNDNRLADGRFNGRTLLHFAASHSCMSVVQLLLSLGGDPDVLDTGGHTPLYRAANNRNPEKGVALVEALVRAGATIDLSGGVNKSTPLHEAARHGNAPVAAALLRLGANPAARDRKGLTPLDRAVNCRRHDVAALLRSHS
jgi:hypothetical protein